VVRRLGRGQRGGVGGKTEEEDRPLVEEDKVGGKTAEAGRHEKDKTDRVTRLSYHTTGHTIGSSLNCYNCTTLSIMMDTRLSKVLMARCSQNRLFLNVDVPV
jgi:hypothetical protein